MSAIETKVLVYRFSKTYTFYPCVSVSIRGPKNKLRKLTERQRKQAIWPRMDTDTHGLKIGTKLYGYVLAKRYTSLIVGAGNTVNPDTQDTELAAVPRGAC